MTGRRKGTPCACSDDCGCSSSKGKCIRAINNISSDPNGDFNVNAGTGIIISGDENGIIIANGMPDPASLIAGDNIEITAVGDDLEIALTSDPVINGDLTVNGDIIQNGAAYETHAEHIYTADDYIIMRDGAISALSAGDYSGFQVKLYDGVNDGRLVIDNSGVARVGDVGDEQPLMTRDEAADLTSGNLLEWDGVNQKAIDSGIDSGDVITDSYQDTGYLTLPAGLSGAIRKCCIAPDVYLYTFIDIVSTSTGDFTIDTLPASFSSCNARSPGLINPNNGSVTGTVYIANGQTTVKLRVFTASSYIVGSFVVGY